MTHPPLFSCFFLGRGETGIDEHQLGSVGELDRCNEVSKALTNILTPDKKMDLAWMISLKPRKEFQFRTLICGNFFAFGEDFSDDGHREI
jgi:hypothetical protein